MLTTTPIELQICARLQIYINQSINKDQAYAWTRNLRLSQQKRASATQLMMELRTIPSREAELNQILVAPHGRTDLLNEMQTRSLYVRIERLKFLVKMEKLKDTTLEQNRRLFWRWGQYGDYYWCLRECEQFLITQQSHILPRLLTLDEKRPATALRQDVAYGLPGADSDSEPASPSAPDLSEAPVPDTLVPVSKLTF